MTEEINEEVDPATETGEEEAVNEESAPSEEATDGEVETDEESEAGGEPEKTLEEIAKENEGLKEELIRQRAAKREAREELARKEEVERQRLEAANAEPLKRPQREDFDTEEGYEDAVVDFRADVREREGAKKRKAEADKAKKERLERNFEAGQADALKRIEGYADLVGIAGDACSIALGDKIKACKNAHDLVAHFGRNPEEARRISELSDLEQAMELGVIANEFKTPVKQKTTTKASAPGKKLKSTGSTGGASGKETTAEYIARMNEEDRAAGRL